MPESRNFDTLPLVMTPDQVADLLQLDVTTVKDWLRAGRLPGFKMGSRNRAVWRIRRDELVRWLDEQSQKKDGNA